MNIERKVLKNRTKFTWKKNGEIVSLYVDGIAMAEYSATHELIIAASKEGFVYVFSEGGEKIKIFEYNSPENRKYYILTRCDLSSSGVSMVFAHDPEIDNERFWKYDVDITKEEVDKRISKWR